MMTDGGHVAKQETEHGAEARTASIVEANVAAIVGVVPALMIFIVAFGFLWDWSTLWSGLDALLDAFFPFLALVIGGVVAHEVLHAVAWRLAGAEAGSVRLGVQWKMLTPYAHSSAPMTARAYRIGAVTPGVVLGVVPMLYGLAVGATAAFWFGILFTLVAGGDALILWLLRGVPGSRLVRDHPSLPGCLVLPPEHAASDA